MKVYIKAVDGVVLIDPKTMRPLADVGEFIELDHYWRRRIFDGSAVCVEGKVEISEDSQIETKVNHDDLV